MQFALSRTLIACALLVSLSIAGAKKVQQQQQPQQATKLKRDAALSFGSGLYHGPSHKYLPPAVTTGYESTYGSLHGNGLSSSSGFDFASLDADSHHHHHIPHHSQHQQYHHFNQHPIPSHGHGHGHGHGPVYIHSSSGSSGYQQHRQQAPKVETYIVQTSNVGGHHGGGHGNALGGVGYKYSTGGSSSGSSGGFLSLLSGGGHGKPQHGVSTYLLATPSYSTGHGIGHGHGNGLGHGQRPSLNLAPQHFGHGLEHQEEHTSGYSYEAPSLHFKQPLSSYGVPLLPGYEHNHHETSVVEEEQHSDHIGHNKPHGGDQQTPSYALGHKGLGHFTYTSSKPQALHTDIHQAEEHNKAPFKPSAFLGAKHETSGAFDFATPTSQYLQPPTASGYDYHAPSVLYGAPAQSGDSAAPIFEPESTYLPPVTSYGAPATPTHNYH